jgi:hypothetical protein
MSKTPPDVGPFTVKAFPIATRDRVKRAAYAQGITQGAWLDRACQTQLRLEAGRPLIQPPGEARPPPEVDTGRLSHQIHTSEDTTTVLVATLVRSAVEAAEASGRPLSKRLAAQVASLANYQVKAALLQAKHSWALVSPRSARGQTSPQLGQTLPQFEPQAAPTNTYLEPVEDDLPELPPVPPVGFRSKTPRDLLPKRAPLAQKLRAERNGGQSG